jgi:hypothetical protein
LGAWAKKNIAGAGEKRGTGTVAENSPTLWKRGFLTFAWPSFRSAKQVALDYGLPPGKLQGLKPRAEDLFVD